MENIQFKDFEGPLDLLLSLLEKDQLNIMDIPIAEITEQYNSIISSWNLFNLEEASDYVLMAARLLQIKSKMLLPKPKREIEEDPREELSRQLALYAIYKKVSSYLESRESELAFKISKDPEYFPESSQESFPILSIKSLERSMRRLLADKPINSSKVNSIKNEKYSVEELKQEILEILKLKETSSFKEVIGLDFNTEKIIVSFLAILELFKTGHLDFNQDEGELLIYRTT